MKMDYPTAWEIARSVPIKKHHPNCSFRQTDGALLCDCQVVYGDSNETSNKLVRGDKEIRAWVGMDKGE